MNAVRLQALHSMIEDIYGKPAIKILVEIGKKGAGPMRNTKILMFYQQFASAYRECPSQQKVIYE